MAGNVLDYVNYDFNELVIQLTDRLNLYATWKDKGKSGTGKMLIELYAYIGNLVLYYVERRANESYLSTAKLRSSLINLVSLLNYQPERRVSARGKVRFSILTVLGKRIFIPRYTELKSVAGYTYLVQNDVVLLDGTLYVDADVVEGTLNIGDVYSNGAMNFEYNLKDINLENSWIYVYVNGEVWTRVNSFVDSLNISKHYIVKNNVDGTISIVFGNNVFGKAPISGDHIVINTITSSGNVGNVYEADKITTLESVVYDEDALAVEVSVTNQDVVLGGEDEETTESIKLAPLFFKAGDRAITEVDFEAMLDAYPGVESVKVWGERDETPPNYVMFNTVRMSMVLQNWLLPGVQFKSDITDYVYSKAPLTVKLEFVDPTIIFVVPEITVKVVANYTLSDVESAVVDAVETLFVLGSTTILGLSKRFSDVSSVIDAVSGVSRYYLKLRVKKILALTGSFSAYNSYAGTFNVLPAKPLSLVVYLGSTPVAYDNGVGGFIPYDSFFYVTGSVDYNTGVVSLDVDSSISDVVSIRYDSDQDGDVVVSKSQIIKLDVVDVISTTYA